MTKRKRSSNALRDLLDDGRVKSGNDDATVSVIAATTQSSSCLTVDAVTLSEMLTTGIQTVWAKLIVAVTSILLVTCLSMYTAAQWLAGRKFLSGASGITEILLCFSWALL
jgi:hypothetical protein